MADTETLADKAKKIGEDVAGVWDVIRDKGGVIPHKLNTENLQDIIGQAAGMNQRNARGMFLYDVDGNFYDFYTKHEVATMTEMPELPEGATSWTMTLQSVKTELETVPLVLVGCMPFKSSTISLHLNLTDSSELSPYICVTWPAESANNRIDWGDGNTSIVSGTGYIKTQHTYQTTGEYDVEIINGSEPLALTVGGDSAKTLFGGYSTSGEATTYRKYCESASFNSKILVGSYALATGSNSGGPSSLALFNAGISVIPTSFCEKNTSIEEIAFPSGVTRIGNRAFYGCTALETVNMPSSVKEIQDTAFGNCSSLVSVNCSPSEDIRCGNSVFDGCPQLILPEELLNKMYCNTGVIAPSSGLHFGSNVALANRVTYHPTIEELSREKDCKLYKTKAIGSVVFPAGATTIPEYYLAGCNGVQSVTWPTSSSFTKIPDYFAYSRWAQTHTLGARNEKLFAGTLVLPNTVKEIGEFAFTFTGLNEITLPNALETIGKYAFAYIERYGDEIITLPDISLVIPATVTSIGEGAFLESAFTEITFEGDVPDIMAYTYQCYSSTLGDYSRNKTYVIDFSNTTRIPTVTTSSFEVNQSGNIKPKIIVPDALYEDWIVYSNWPTYAQYVVKASEA